MVPRSVWEAVEVGLTGGGADQNCAFDNDRDGQFSLVVITKFRLPGLQASPPPDLLSDDLAGRFILI